jgi:hypothetical protein
MAKALPLATDPNPIYGGSHLFTEQLGATGQVGDPINITGSCGLDPAERHRAYPVVALATDKLKAGTGTLGLSGMRSCKHATPPGPGYDDVLSVHVTGMNYGTHMFGVVQMYFEGDSVLPGSGLTPGPTTLWGDPIVIDGAMLARNTLELTGQVPCTIAGKEFRCSAELFGLDFTPGLVITPLRQTPVMTIEH